MAISAEHQEKVDRLRRFLGDDAELNKLLGVEESTDNFLYEALLDAIDEINIFGGITTSWTLDTVPSWVVVKIGATLQVLTGKGILSARNTLTYNDTGGVTVQDMDTYGRYINYFNILIAKYQQSLRDIKRSYNIDQAYGGVSSEYGLMADTSDGYWW